MESILKIKNTIAFLEKTNPQALSSLKQKFPEHADFLDGKEKYGAEDHADTEAKQQAVLQVSLASLKDLPPRVRPLQDNLRKRLIKAKNLNTLASLIAVFSSTVLVVLINNDHQPTSLKLAVAVVNLLATALPIVAKWFETSKYGGEKNMQQYLTEINSVFAEATALQRLLQKDLDLHNYDDDTVKNIKRTDEILSKLPDIDEQLR